MRFLMKFSFPLDKFNQAVLDGSVGPKLQRILEEIQPEAVYFTSEGGRRGGTAVVNLNSASEIPRYAEPFFLYFDAEIQFYPAMTPDDLAAAGLDELGRKWS